MERFLKAKKRLSDLHLHRLDYKFLVDFESFLRAWKPKDHQRPLHNNGVMKHMSRLKKMINLAIRMEWMEKNPFKNYRMKFIYTPRECLTDNELGAIEGKEFSISRLSIVRDIFVFCCYTGLSHIDILHLRDENIVHGIDGKKWISFKRHKTNHAFQVPLLPKALKIIEKYKDHPRINEGAVLPVFSNQKTNSYLKEIADLCGVKKNLTFHLARHTFATTVTLSNGVPIESVSKMLGHTKIATTQIYARVVERKLSEDMEKLREKLEATAQVNNDLKAHIS